MNVGRFRIGVIVWAILYAWWSALPLSSFKQSVVVREALEHSGRGALVLPNDALADFLLLGTILTAGGLFLLQHWARMTLVLLTVLQVVLGLVSGVVVAGPFEGTLGFILTLLNGALVAVVFVSPVAPAFAKPSSPDEPGDEDGVPADDNSSVEAVDSEDDRVQVYETSDPSTIVLVQSLLRSAEIEFTTLPGPLPDVVADGQQAAFNPAAVGVRFFVRRSDALLARDVLALGEETN